MKRILPVATVTLLCISWQPARAWIEFLDGSALPGAPWASFVDGQSDSTTVIEFIEPDLSTNNALRITTTGNTANEWFVYAFLNFEQTAGARFRLVEFSSTGKINLLSVTTRSTLLGPAASVTLVDGRYKLWNYATLADTEIIDLGPAVSNQWHTAYLWARNDGKVKLWWDGKLVFDGTTPLVNPSDGYMEWGCGSWQYSAAATAEFDWVGWGNDFSDLPINLTTSPAHRSSYNTNTTFSFTAIDTNGIAANAFSISLNGINRTADLVVTGTSTNRQGAISGLLSDKFYEVVLTLTDLATNTSSYTISFDTINQNHFHFEAEDWNFTNGMFLNTVVLSSTAGASNYVDRLETIGVDALDNDIFLTNSTRLYRADSAPGTEQTGDLLRQKYIDAQLSDPLVTDYNLGWVDQGEWLNYTRTFPSGQYNIYGRLSSGNPGIFEASLAKVTGATTTNQTLSQVGSFKGVGRGWQVYSLIPLTDAQSNRVAVSLGGVETLRVTATNGGYNANFYLLAPAEPIRLEIQRSGGNAAVSWFQLPGEALILQTATNILGPWTNVINQANPYFVATADATRFFRLTGPPPAPPSNDIVVNFNDAPPCCPNIPSPYHGLNWSAAWFYESDPYGGFGPQAYLGLDTNPTTGRISGGTNGPFLLKSLKASTASGVVTLSLTNNGTGESASVVLSALATPVQITTGWTNFSTSVDVRSSAGYNAAIDDITYSR